MEKALYFLVNVISSYYAQVIFRILLAVCFGALIGLEREHAHRPAGLRTHILVCVGSCLVMLTSEFTYNAYHQFSPNMDVNRLGAQVISGVGFLGAGTIIRNGSSIKGLTTAASIWAVACVGLATGVGFYLGAGICTIAIFIILAYIKNSFKLYDTKKFYLYVTASSPDILPKIEEKLFNNSIVITNVSLKSLKDNICALSFNLSANASISTMALINEIYSLPSIASVNINEKEIISEE